MACRVLIILDQKNENKCFSTDFAVVMMLTAFRKCFFSVFFFFFQVRIYAPLEQIDQVEYASKITDELFTFYENYFQIKYTLPKTGETSNKQNTNQTITQYLIKSNTNKKNVTQLKTTYHSLRLDVF